MIAHWFLLLLLAPGWLLPAGVRVPLCGCQFMASDAGSCCAEVETRSCCAVEDESSAPEKSVQRDGECHCSVDVPSHEPARVVHLVSVSVPFALPPETVRFALAGTEPALVRAIRPDRPRGPSPGRPNPAPLRL